MTKTQNKIPAKISYFTVIQKSSHFWVSFITFCNLKIPSVLKALKLPGKDIGIEKYFLLLIQIPCWPFYLSNIGPGYVEYVLIISTLGIQRRNQYRQVSAMFGGFSLS
jgi:hypothetical protein